MNAPIPRPISSDTLRHIDQSLANVRDALLNLSFGNIALTVHEGRVVQIDITEKKRLNFS
ncbi:DUF2292 domain-containing protein [Pseudonocardia sp. TMWB2A]|uniref:YezD family protein n=1 Tax=Pseudonocardia sp. TMWB2A TaxID=687430 RepID=UPI00307E28AE